MSEVWVDGNGFPVLLADVPNAGTSSVDSNAASGNPRHDTRSGKFSAGGDRKRGPSQINANADPVELALRTDAVRDAARKYEGVTVESAEEFLKTRVRDMSLVDMNQFLQMVRQQRLDDLADILAVELGQSQRSNKVRISAQTGYSRRVFAGLSDEEVVGMAMRMERRGFSDKKIRSSFLGRIKDPERRQLLEDRYGEARKTYSNR